MEIFLRFLIGGVVVSTFAAVGGLFKPTSFAGLFGAAPSVALATLGLAIAHDGTRYARLECRSMIAGAVALGLYSCVVTRLLLRYKLSAAKSTISCVLVWFLAAFGLWRIFLH